MRENEDDLIKKIEEIWMMYFYRNIFFSFFKNILKNRPIVDYVNLINNWGYFNCEW